MRVVSFNIHNRRGESPKDRKERLKRIAAFLTSLKPDLVGLQEVTPDAWEQLVDYLGEPPAAYTPRLDGFRSGEGAPVFCLNPDITVLGRHSFWFSETPEAPSLDWRAAHPRVCSYLQFQDEEQGDYWLFNLHLDHKSRQARRKSLQLLRKRISETCAAEDRILIIGDFNMPGYRKEVREFLDGPPECVDATRFNPIGALRPTFMGWGPFRLAKARIDLCLHSKNLQTDSYHAENPEWEDQIISDHRAVVVEVSADSSTD